MFPIELEQSEQIELVDGNAKLLNGDKAKAVCVVITTNRFILYEDGNKQIDSKEILRITKATSCLPSYGKLIEADVSFFEQIVREEFFDKYIFQNGNYFHLNSEETYQFFKKKGI